MNKNLGIVLIVSGLFLAVLGISASESFSSEVSRFFTGTPTDKSIWLMLTGVTLVAAGTVATQRRA